MGEDTTVLQEIRSDLKEIKVDLGRFQVELADIKAKMPTMDKVQQLEIQITHLQAQFKVVWAGLGGVGVVAIGSMVSNLLRLLGMQ